MLNDTMLNKTLDILNQLQQHSCEAKDIEKCLNVGQKGLNSWGV